MRHMRFKKNFNKKLDCDFFTTFRFSNKWKVSDDIIIFVGDDFRFGKIVDVRPIRLQSLTDWHCYLDSGMDRVQTLELLSNYYTFDVHNENPILYYYLVQGKDKWRSVANHHPFIELKD